MIGDRQTLAMIDTGSMVTTMSESFYKIIAAEHPLKTLDDFVLLGANGDAVPYLGYIEVQIQVPNLKIQSVFAPVLITRDTAFSRKIPVIVGMNVIRELYRGADENDDISGSWQQVFSAISMRQTAVVTTTKPITLKPMETRTITGFVRKTANMEAAITEPIQDNRSHSALICPRVVTLSNPGRTARVPVRICNMSEKIMKIRPKADLCQLDEVKVLRHAEMSAVGDDKPTVIQQTVVEEESNEQKSIKETYGVEVDESELTNAQIERLLAVFRKWNKVFPKTPKELGHTDAVRHRIILTDDKPFKEPCRRVHPSLMNEVREHLKEMLEDGVIRESSSPWASNVVIVRKKDGTIRFCIDLRKLNQRTKKDAYSIPRIEDTLHLLRGAKYFSKLDLKSGYWQIELADEDKEKTAFQVAGLGHYECNRMPFGLCNAPATFQRLMERCMGEINLRDCLIYLDDIIIFSSDIDSHIDRLDAVFQRLAEYGLKIKPSKCEFFQKRIVYLGHIVSDKGIEAEPEKTEAVKNWPTPKSVKEVRKFLGFIGYYRRFIKGFASIARPLNDLLVGHPTKKTKKSTTVKSKKAPFVWEQRQQQAFEELKDKLVQPPILGYADYNLPFRLHTDASGKGLGAVLYQHQDGRDRVIAYASRSLKPAEQNYPAHKLEFLALKWSVTEKFHDYLYGAQVEVVTDNNPLTYVTTSAKLDATGQRWMASLANYNFTIKYRKGSQNADADGLSRIPQRKINHPVNQPAVKATEIVTSSDLGKAPLCFSVVNPEALQRVESQMDVDIPEDVVKLHALTSKDWKSAQQQDEIISSVSRHLQRGTRPSFNHEDRKSGELRFLKEWKKLEVKDGILCLNGNKDEQDHHRIVVPERLREDVFRAYHDDLGHQGRDRTLSLLKSRFYWPGMDQNVSDFVKVCQRCLRSKRAAATATLVPIETTTPLEVVCIDFLSLEKSKGGYENILVITDHFSRYAQAFPTRNQTAKTTARVLFENFIVHYGFPARIHSDQGANFESTLIQELCDLAGVAKSHTTPYHAMGNGMVERFNQTLLRMLSTLNDDQKSDWKSHVASLVHAYNVTLHPSTGFSPYFLLFGREPRLVVDVLFGVNQVTLKAADKTEYARKLRERLVSAYRRARECAEKTAETNKKYYDQKKARAATVKEGDLVLVRNVTVRGKQKIADRWESDPYVVLRQPNPDLPVFEVKKDSSRSTRIRTLHRNLLLPIGYSTSRECDEDDDDDEDEDSVAEDSAIEETAEEKVDDISKDERSGSKDTPRYVIVQKRPSHPAYHREENVAVTQEMDQESGSLRRSSRLQQARGRNK